MSTTLIVYCLTATLLLVHEIESAFEREWEILRLPGGVSGFMLIHVPVILLVLYGTVELSKGTRTGSFIALAIGLAGILPVAVHDLLVRRTDRFHRLTSQAVLIVCAASGLVLIGLSLASIVK